MSQLAQTLIAAFGASGICTWVFTQIIARQMNKQYEKLEQRERLRKENDLLMMSRMDNLSEMTHLMAAKLHDAGIINGDLEELDSKYKQLDARYNENLKKLALEVLNK